VVVKVPKPKSKKFWSFKALDENTGELLLYGEISNHSWWGDEVTPKQFREDLEALGDIDTLEVFINSPGGDVFAAQAIYSILKRYNAQVNIYVDGLAASAASLIAMAGDKITMPGNAMMMIHNPWTIAVGNAQDFRKLADDMDKIRDGMIVAYESRSPLLREEIIKMLDAETWLSADDCLEYGFCDEIEDEKQVAACLDKEVLGRYKNTPEGLLADPEPGPDDPGPDPDEEAKARELKKKTLALELELI
jgi:ATP-dependent Clp protease protease subunit